MSAGGLEMNRNRSKSRVDRTMPMVHPNAAAIDIGATMHMAAVRADRTPEPVRSFGTFTADLHRLVDWFTQCGVETVVMESTSVYWIPVFELLDARGFTVFLVNARDAKHVPGRKTDVSDAQSARASAGVRGLAHPAYAKGLDGDESSTPPRRRRHHRRHRPAHHPRDP